MQDGRKVTLILDSSHHGMRTMSVCRKEETAEEGYQMWKYMFLNGIFYFIEQFKADEVIIAMDDRKNWRKSVFPYYKGMRKVKRDRDDKQEKDGEGWFSFSDYFKVYDSFVEEIVNSLPIKSIKIDYAEADDIAGVLSASKELEENHKVIVTTDKDYVQLMENPFTKIYNPIAKKFMECDDPKTELLRKIVLGDKGDHVPSIKDVHTFKPEFFEFCVNEGVADNEHNAKVIIENDEDVLFSMEILFQEKYGIKPSRVRVFPNKVFNSLIKEGKLMEHIQGDKTLKTKFLRNNKLVNLKAQPQELKDQILDTYNETKIKVRFEKLFDLFVGNTFSEFMRDHTRICNLIRTLD